MISQICIPKYINEMNNNNNNNYIQTHQWLVWLQPRQEELITYTMPNTTQSLRKAKTSTSKNKLLISKYCRGAALGLSHQPGEIPSKRSIKATTISNSSK